MNHRLASRSFPFLAVALTTAGLALFLLRPVLRPAEAGTCSEGRVSACAGTFTVRVHTSDGSGSGFLIDDTHVVTAAHVVSGSSDITISFGDDETPRPALSITADTCADIALISLQPTHRRPAAFRDLNKLGDDDTVYAAGFPGGHDYSVSSGHIRGTRGELSFLRGLVQTDVTVHPGNSGGPLVDKRGEVVGLVIARIAGSDHVSFVRDAGALQTEVAALRDGRPPANYCEQFTEDCTMPSAKTEYTDVGCTPYGFHISALKQGSGRLVPASYQPNGCRSFSLRTRGVSDGSMFSGLVLYGDDGRALVTEIAPGRQYGFWEAEGTNATVVKRWTGSTAIKASAANEMRLDVDGDLVRLYVNGDFVDTFTDPTLHPTGRFGFSGRSYDASPEPSTAYFPWVEFLCR